MSARFFLPALLGTIALACSSDESTPSWTGTVDTLENGTVLISNPSVGLLGADPWPLVEESKIGSVEGDGPETFGAVIAIEVDRLGRIYVLDRQAQEVRVFEADGRYVRTMGRMGEGPGEFRGANGMGWGAPNRLWVVDKRLHRFNVFDTSGVSVATYRAPMTVRAWAWLGSFSADGDAYDVGVDINDPEYLESAGDREPPYIFLRFDRTLTQWADTFPAPPSNFQPEIFDWTNSRGIGSIMQIPYAPRAIRQFSPEPHVWTGISNQYRIYELTLLGDTLRAIEREYSPISVSPEEREAALEQVRDAAAGMPFDASRIPATKPAFVRFEVDEHGALWVLLPYDAGRAVTAFDIFDLQGRYLGQVSTPYRVYQYARFVVRKGKLYFVAVDDLDVPYVITTSVEERLGDAPIGIQLSNG